SSPPRSGREASWRRHPNPRPSRPARRAKSARRIRAAKPWPGIHGYSSGRSPNPHMVSSTVHLLVVGIPYTNRTATLKTTFAPQRGESLAKSTSEQVGRDFLAGVDQPLNGAYRLVEGFAVLAGQLDLDDALDALRADDDGNADIHVLHAVFAVEIGGAGQHALLVLQIALGHRHGGSGRRVERGTGLQQVHDLGAAVAGAVDDLVDARLRGPAHLDQIRQRNAGYRGIAHQRHHGIAVAAEHEGGDVFDRDVEFVGEEIAEARGIQHARHADHLLVRHAGRLLQRPHHRVQRVGDADDERVGGILLDAGADLLHDLEIDAQKIVAAHAGLARHAGGDDADLGIVERVVGIGAGEMGVETVDRGRLRDVERLALRNAFGDVEHHDVAELLQADEVSQRSADLTGANQSNLVARHGKFVLLSRRVEGWIRKLDGWLSLSNGRFKPERAQFSILPRFRSGMPRRSPRSLRAKRSNPPFRAVDR